MTSRKGRLLNVGLRSQILVKFEKYLEDGATVASTWVIYSQPHTFSPLYIMYIVMGVSTCNIIPPTWANWLLILRYGLPEPESGIGRVQAPTSFRFP